MLLSGTGQIQNWLKARATGSSSSLDKFCSGEQLGDWLHCPRARRFGQLTDSFDTIKSFFS